MADHGFNEDVMRCLVNQQQLSAAWHESQTIQKRWGVIREFYMRNMADIDKAGPYGWGIDAYEIPIYESFSPIEELAWAEIRSSGIVMYPQYPVFNWFIDFANPSLRIGLELDGAAYHTPEKDAAKDEFLHAQGWKIFRITGSQMNRYMPMPEESREDFDWADWFESTGDGVISALDRVYFRPNQKGELKKLALRALSKHTTAKV